MEFKTWKTADGREIPLDEVNTDHILNCIDILERGIKRNQETLDLSVHMFDLMSGHCAIGSELIMSKTLTVVIDKAYVKRFKEILEQRKLGGN